VQIFAAVDLPLAGWLPVGDLSTHIKGASEIQKQKQADLEAGPDGGRPKKKGLFKRS
jgi:hypothetical protein